MEGEVLLTIDDLKSSRLSPAATILDHARKAGLPVKFHCLACVTMDTLRDEIVKAAKDAGCNTVQYDAELGGYIRIRWRDLHDGR